MSDELVERLRGDWFGYDVSLKAIDAMDEAADAIEQLTAERDHAWEMAAKADTQMGQSLADNLQAKAERDEAWAYMSTLQGDLYDAEKALTAERDRLRALLAEADRRIVWEANGFGNDFADQVQAALKGETP